ncbi:hypothetical protein [uncultured Pontibacter sp.]|uniref:hypothetical protein n=1 Tax=uncultured Pontibacter sp. TaxID=453356 RepID=UPI00262ECB25|nr:hypothetical protein [uncultured Pontibacter sp.]
MFESDFYTIEVDVEANLLRSKWHRPVSEAEMKAGGIKLYQVLRDTRVERAVANAQALGVLTPPAKEWMSTEFYELLSQTRLKRLARVLPASVFHQIALESVITRAEALGKIRFNVKSFSDPAKAIAWAKAIE